MNLFGPALGKLLDDNKIARQEFAESCGMHRNQMTNIVKGISANPNNIGIIFAALRGLVSEFDRIALAIMFLEDRRVDVGFSSSDISIKRFDGSGVNSARTKLLHIYDTDPDVRLALDAIIDVIEPRRISYPEQSDRSTFGASTAAESDQDA